MPPGRKEKKGETNWEIPQYTPISPIEKGTPSKELSLGNW